MVRYRGSTLCFAFSGLIGLVTGQARAGSITMTITVPGHSILVDGQLVASQSPTDFIVDTTSLNQVLTGDGSALQFSSLEARSDFPGGPTDGTLSQFGLVEIPVGAQGSTYVTIQVSQDGFTSPYFLGPLPPEIKSFTSATFENTVAGDSQQLTSVYNRGPSSSAAVFSTGPAPNGSSAMGETFISAYSLPYSVTNTMSIALTPNTNAVSQDQFFGQSTVTPEPAGLVLLSMGMFLSLVTVRLVRAKR